MSSAGRLVIVGCGMGKQEQPARAGELYTGSYFASCLRAAFAIAPRPRILILSAKHGLVSLDTELAPYDVTLGDPGAITAAGLAHQADELGVRGEPVTALCSARYATLLAAVFADVARPLAGLGIGQQRALLARLGQQGELW